MEMQMQSESREQSQSLPAVKDKRSLQHAKCQLREPTRSERLFAVSALAACFAVWAKFTLANDGDMSAMHTWKTPASVTAGYLASIPALRYAVKDSKVDMKALLMECMVLYNAAQVVLNGWMVYSFLSQVLFHGHPFVGSVRASGCLFPVWVHYMDKYLEFFDTWFMVLRGRNDQVSFLHVYHHTTIAWAWWAALCVYPGGDSYFGALLNSWIHVMMYSYYCLALLGIKCPWKKYLTMSQLAQFTAVVIYSVLSYKYLPDDERTVSHYMAYAIQVGEMTSLFVLFTHFYRKSYVKRERINGKEKGYDDECQKAVTNAIESSAQVTGLVRKAAGKSYNRVQ